MKNSYSSKIMKRRNFVKQSVAGAIVAATPLALTGLVRADGGGGNTTTTNESTDFWNSTDWWGSTEATVPWESTIWESTIWESTDIWVSTSLYEQEDPCEFADKTFKAREIHHLQDRDGVILSSWCVITYECNTTPVQTCIKEEPCPNPFCGHFA
jgi:hypothetical protein